MYYKSIIYILIYISCLIASSYQAATPDHGSLLACGPLMFDCGNGVCIPRSWRCDGDTDCANGNDEKSCDTDPATSQCDEKNFYKCKETSPGSRSSMSDLRWRSLAQLFPSSCIPLKWKCDGEFDCPEQDDELGCNEIKCGEGQFKCKGFAHHATSCIPNSWVCDGQSDCVDMSDEAAALCGPEKKKEEKCADDEFRCTDGQCIFASWQCDGEFDCKDNSDENESCKNQPCNATTHFQCTNSHFCLPIAWKCDGQGDCPDHSDEKGCTDVKVAHPITCSKDEFKCKNGAECIRNAWVCDGDNDCSDASDEANCTESAQKCGVDETLCSDDICRVSCGTTPKPIQVCDTNKSYKCSDTTCISLNRLCEGNSSVNDCLDSVCDRKILQCNPSDSPYCQCRDTTKGGRICYCPSGFERRGDSCIDINECEQPGTCDQKCTNLMGTYKCECYPGFQLTGGKIVDGEGISHPPRKCRAVGDDPLLFLSNRIAIRQYDLVTNKYHPLVNKLDSAVAMDYWHKNRTLIWSDVSKEQIVICQMTNKTNLFECKDGENKILIDKNISTPDGLAVDWVHGLLFWTDTGLDSINVYDLVNNKRQVLFNTSLEEPRAIAVDPTAGLLFWTDWISTQKIERAGMDGKDRVEVISGNAVRWPNGLAVDIYDQRIYWADAKTKAISSCDYWGKDVRTVLHSHEFLKHPFSLSVFEERLYWTDWDHEGVLSVNKFSGDDVKPVMNGVPGPMTVRIFHQMAQPNHTNKCDLHQCEHLCLPRAHIRKSNVEDEERITDLPYSCGCDMGFQLSGLTKCLPENGIIDAIAEEISGTSNSSNHALLIFFICGLVVSAILVMGYVYRQKRFARFSALNFDNPIYRRTIEEGNDFEDNSIGAIPVNPATQEPRLILSNSVTAQYNRDQAAYMDNDPLNDRRGIY